MKRRTIKYVRPHPNAIALEKKMEEERNKAIMKKENSDQQQVLLSKTQTENAKKENISNQDIGDQYMYF